MLISPYVATFGLIDNQKISMDLVYEFWCNPAQGHPNLILRYIVVILKNQTTCTHSTGTGTGTGRSNSLLKTHYQTADLVSAVRKPIVSNLNGHF